MVYLLYYIKIKLYFKINDKVLRHKGNSSQCTGHRPENVNFIFVPNTLCKTFPLFMF